MEDSKQTKEKNIELKSEIEQEKKEEQNEQNDDIVIDPYKVVNNTQKDIDYQKLIVQFGCQPMNQQLITRMEELTKRKAHRFIRRNIFFAHRELDLILNAFQKNRGEKLAPFFLYTGRGPSSEALHLGHMLPFIFCQYLQETFGVPLVIQITDDEKYFHKEGGDLNEFTDLAIENIKDIIALGFDPVNTFIFIDSQYMGYLYPNVCRFQRHINMSTLKAIFGLEFADNCGKAAYPAIQAAPCLSSSFPHIFGNANLPCLIPCGIDQDPYFRMTRDVCNKIKAPKPASLYSKFFPALQGFGSKMSASVPNSGIFMTDTPKQIADKIKKHAFSGGRALKEEQEKYGANLQVDVSYQYLRFFLEDDEILADITQKYSTGKMLTGELKNILIGILQDFVAKHQAKRKQVTREHVDAFLALSPRPYKPV